jgi:hypothetical protein
VDFAATKPNKSALVISSMAGSSNTRDILTRLGDAFTFADLEIVRVPFEEMTVSAASPRTLYRMKRDTVRLKDRADAALLKERFKLDEDR